MQEPLDVPVCTADKRGKDSDRVAAMGSGVQAEEEKKDSSTRLRNRDPSSSATNESDYENIPQENEELLGGRRHRK